VRCNSCFSHWKLIVENIHLGYRRVLARIIFKRIKKHVATTRTRRLREIFLVKCQKQTFSFNKREAFLHVLKRDTCIKHEKTKKKFMQAAHVCRSARVPARHAKMPWLDPCNRICTIAPFQL
jgi:hypothetical protein